MITISSILWRRARLWLKLFSSTAEKFFTRISYLPSYAFLRRRRRFTSRKLYACLEKFFCFLQLSDRAKFLELNVQGSFSFDSSRTTEFELNPYGSHQLPVYLKYCVRLKLLAHSYIGESVRHSAAWHKLLVVCTLATDRKCLVSIGYNSQPMA